MQDVLEGYYKSVDEAIAVQNNYYELDKDSNIYLDTDRVKVKRDIGIEFNTDDFLVCEDGRVWKDKFYEDRHKKYLDYKDAIGKLAKREAENKKGEIISLYIEELKKELAEGGKYYTGFVPYKQLSSNDEIMALSEKYSSDEVINDNSEQESIIDIKYGEFTISIIDGSQIMVTNSEGVIYQGKGAEEIVNKYLEDENIEFDLSTRFIILKILNGNTEIENENPEDTRYNYQYVPWHIVEENPDEYIIPECQNACKALWNNNIGTFMCSNLNELDDTKYVDLNSLSKKNIELIEQLIKDGVPGYSYDSYRNAYRIYANGEGEEVAKKLEDLAKVFEMQDVLEGFYANSEEALIEQFGIRKRVPNPGYVAGPPITSKIDRKYLEASSRYEKNFSGINKSEYLYIYDPSKKEKSEDEYFEEKGFIKDEDGIIWISDFYRKKHERYVQYMKGNGIEIKADDLRKAAGKGMSFLEVKNIRRILKSLTEKNEEKKPDDNS